MNKLFIGLVVAGAVTLPCFAGEPFDTTTVGADTTLNDGAGTSGPGMSGDYSFGGKIGTTDSRAQLVSSTNGHSRKSYRIKSGFSRRAIYNNDANIAQPHIR